jgi:uncharacterized FAD-dependent dehydrogenase
MQNIINTYEEFNKVTHHMSINMKASKHTPIIYSHHIHIGTCCLIETKYNILKYLSENNAFLTGLLKNFETDNKYWNYPVPEEKFASIKDEKIRKLIVEFFKTFVNPF